MLLQLWLALLQDYSVLSTQPAAVQASYTPRLFAAPSNAIRARVLRYLETAWPAVLDAATSVLTSTQCEFLPNIAD